MEDNIALAGDDVIVVPVVPLEGGVGNTRVTPSRHWFFTLNNPTDQDIALWKNNGSRKYVCQLEKGEAGGTIHIQGYVDFERKVRPLSEIKDSRYHWEKCRDIKRSVEYCSKVDTRLDGPWGPLAPYTFQLKSLRDWQAELLKVAEGEPDDRSVYWITDKVGGQGKTQFCKHLVMNMPGCLYLSGKAADIKYAISEYIAAGGRLRVALFDFPRTLENFVSYEAIESIKNGIFFSGKYESNMQVFKPPHVFCFANFEPMLDNLSRDRWRTGLLSQLGRLQWGEAEKKLDI